MDIFDKLIHDFRSSSAWVELLILLVCLLLAYTVVRWWGRNLKERERVSPIWFGSKPLDGAMLPMLALMTLFHSGMGLHRKSAIVLAWLLSALLFGALHLPTYGWNLIQCFAVIGSARLVLSLAYLWTKNLWASAGAHLLNDWALFGLALLLTGLPAQH